MHGDGSVGLVTYAKNVDIDSNMGLGFVGLVVEMVTPFSRSFCGFTC